MCKEGRQEKSVRFGMSMGLFQSSARFLWQFEVVQGTRRVLVLHGEVLLVEMVETNVGVFGAGSESLSVRGDGNASHGTEVTHVGANFVFVDGMEESGSELLGVEFGGGHSLSALSSTKEDVVLERGDDGAVDRASSLVGLEDFESLSVQQLGGSVLGGGDNHTLLLIETHLVDRSSVQCLVQQHLARLRIVNSHASLLIAGVDRLVKAAPSGLRDLRCALDD